MKQVVVGNETFHVDEVPGYLIDETGVYYGSSASIEDRISGLVFAKSVIKKGSDRVVVVCAKDRYTDTMFTESFPASEFVSGTSMVATVLANRGLAISPKKVGKLREYLSECLDVFTPDRVFGSYQKTGWHLAGDGKHIFVFPNQFIGASEDGDVFMPATQTPFHENIGEKGTLAEWQEHIANKAIGQPMLMMAIGASFAAPLLHLLEQDGFGFHFFATSSKGKTIAAQAAASAWGCGRAPTSGAGSSYVRSWYGTQNAMEAQAEAHNHIAYVIDEVGLNNIKNFGDTVYMLANGSGKGASNINRDLKVIRSWLNVMISTGERSIKEMIEISGQRAMTGQLIRFIDFDVNEGLFPSIAPDASVAYADALRDACAKYYGTAAVKFLTYLAGRLNSDDAYKGSLMEAFQASYERLMRMYPKFLPEQKRALKRFALVETALVLACDAGCVGYSSVEIKGNVKYAVDKWVETMPLISEKDRAYEALREYVLMFPNKIFNLDRDPRAFSDVACYFSLKEGRYYFTEKMLINILERGNIKPILEALDADGFLVKTNGEGRKKTKKTIDGKRVHMYAIYSRFFEVVVDEPEAVVAESVDPVSEPEPIYEGSARIVSRMKAMPADSVSQPTSASVPKSTATMSRSINNIPIKPPF